MWSSNVVHFNMHTCTQCLGICKNTQLLLLLQVKAKQQPLALVLLPAAAVLLPPLFPQPLLVLLVVPHMQHTSRKFARLMLRKAQKDL